MALIKSIAIGNTGTSAAYWKIAHKSESYIDGFVKVDLIGYVSKDIRESEGGQYIDGRTVVISGTAYTPEMVRTDLYDAIKAIPDGDFAGSTDDL